LSVDALSRRSIATHYRAAAGQRAGWTKIRAERVQDVVTTRVLVVRNLGKCPCSLSMADAVFGQPLPKGWKH
jgi:hypothetical protein